MGNSDDLFTAVSKYRNQVELFETQISDLSRTVETAIDSGSSRRGDAEQDSDLRLDEHNEQLDTLRRARQVAIDNLERSYVDFANERLNRIDNYRRDFSIDDIGNQVSSVLTAILDSFFNVYRGVIESNNDTADILLHLSLELSTKSQAPEAPDTSPLPGIGHVFDSPDGPPTGLRVNDRDVAILNSDDEMKQFSQSVIDQLRGELVTTIQRAKTRLHDHDVSSVSEVMSYSYDPLPGEV